MLVLSRKKSECIQIGENIVVRIVRTGRNSVQLGIEAPRGIRILRGEIGSAARSESSTKHSVRQDSHPAAVGRS